MFDLTTYPKKIGNPPAKNRFFHFRHAVTCNRFDRYYDGTDALTRVIPSGLRRSAPTYD